MKQPPKFSKRIVDPINSVAWFAMDGLWLAEFPWPAFLAAGVTLATGALLIALDRRQGQRLNDDLALNAWMWMNALWVVADLGGLPRCRSAAQVVGCVGAVLLANAIRPSQRHQQTLHRFRKIRRIARHR